MEMGKDDHVHIVRGVTASRGDADGRPDVDEYSSSTGLEQVGGRCAQKARLCLCRVLSFHRPWLQVLRQTIFLSTHYYFFPLGRVATKNQNQKPKPEPKQPQLLLNGFKLTYGNVS
jgi:hypothetical protein